MSLFSAHADRLMSVNCYLWIQVYKLAAKPTFATMVVCNLQSLVLAKLLPGNMSKNA